MARRYDKEFKEQVLREVEEIGSVPPVAKRHGISDKTIYVWIKKAKHGDWQETPDSAMLTKSYVPSPQEYKALESENDKLKQILGDKDLEIAILRDLLKKTNPALVKKLK